MKDEKVSNKAADPGIQAGSSSSSNGQSDGP